MFQFINWFYKNDLGIFFLNTFKWVNKNKMTTCFFKTTQHIMHLILNYIFATTKILSTILQHRLRKKSTLTTFIDLILTKKKLITLRLGYLPRWNRAGCFAAIVCRSRRGTLVFVVFWVWLFRSLPLRWLVVFRCHTVPDVRLFCTIPILPAWVAWLRRTFQLFIIIRLNVDKIQLVRSMNKLAFFKVYQEHSQTFYDLNRE